MIESKTSESGFFVARRQIINQARDFEIEAKIKIVSGDGTAMLQWGGNDANNFYFLGFNNEGAGLVGNWSVGVSAGNEISNLKINDFNKLTLRRIGENYHIYINEVYYEVLEFEPFMGSSIGFLVGPSTEIHIDDLLISYLD
jgi:hypothetical protein